jgi:hypothetical protein
MTTEEISKAFVERTHETFFHEIGQRHSLSQEPHLVTWAGYLFLKYGDAKYTPTERLEP